MVEFQENIIFRTTLHEIPDQISNNNMGEVKIEFQENNNGLRFLRRPLFFMGIFFYECRFQMIMFIISR